MSAAVAARVLRQLVRNPRARRYARSAGLGMVRGIGRSRVRRARRGRWYAGRRMGIPPSLSYRRTPRIKTGFAATTGMQSVATQPAAYNVSSTMVAGRMRMSKCEKAELVVDCENDDSGGLHVYALTPTESRLWPVLAQTCYTYTKYRYLKLVAEYRPRTGTTANGTVYMGWQPQMNTDTTQFNDVAIVSSMPRSTTTTVRQGAKLEIPITQPQEKYMGAPKGQTYDPVNYYNGTFVITAQGDNAESVGEIWMSYVIELIQPKIDTTTKTSAFNFGTGEAERGLFQCRAAEAGHCSVSSLMPISALVRIAYASGTPTITVNKDGVAQANTVFIVGSTHAHAIVHLGSCSHGADITVTIGGVSATAVAAMFYHTVADF